MDDILVAILAGNVQGCATTPGIDRIDTIVLALKY
jgi:hypothetical protein